MNYNNRLFPMYFDCLYYIVDVKQSGDQRPYRFIWEYNRETFIHFREN